MTRTLLLLGLAGCAQEPRKDGDPATETGGPDTTPTTTDTPPARVEVCPIAGEPELVTELPDPALNEISGAVASRQSPGIWWIQEDKGNPSRLLAFDATGAIVGDYGLPEDDVDDIEDLGVFHDPVTGRSRLYVADTGDNDWKILAERRPSVWFYVVDEPDVAPGQPLVTDDLDYARITLTYPDIPRDAEAILVDPRNEDVYIVSKDYSGLTLVFRKPAPHVDGEEAVLEQVGTLDLPGAQTAGAFSPDGAQVLIRGYGSSARIWLRQGDTPMSEVLLADPCELKLAIEPQSETATYAPDGSGVYTISEIPALLDGALPLLWITPLTPGTEE